MKYNKKLILFDIDGTLVRVQKGASYGAGERIVVGIKRAYGIELPRFDQKKLEGRIERDIVWRLVSKKGISRHEFQKKFPTYLTSMLNIVKEKAKDKPIFSAIPDASQLAKALFDFGVSLGVLTGNAENIARWKLQDTGLSDLFPFGLFGDEADDRLELARLVFFKAYKHFGVRFKPKDIIIIGDTTHDIAAGRAIGARVIAVSSGPIYAKETLQQAKPDLLVSTLSDRRVWQEVAT